MSLFERWMGRWTAIKSISSREKVVSHKIVPSHYFLPQTDIAAKKTSFFLNHLNIPWFCKTLSFFLACCHEIWASQDLQMSLIVSILGPGRPRVDTNKIWNYSKISYITHHFTLITLHHSSLLYITLHHSASLFTSPYHSTSFDITDFTWYPLLSFKIPFNIKQ